MPKAIRLLLIEDVEDHALLVVRELKKGGFEPDFRRVETLQELEEALSGGEWDAIISDFNLPGFDGIDALRMVQDKRLDLPFLLVSGAIGEEKAAEVMKAGAHDYIRKGNYARLVPTLERELRDARIRQERRLTAEELSRHREHLEELVQERTAELIRVNEALQAEKQEREQILLQLEAVLESIEEGVIISDLQGNVLMMNREAMAIHQYHCLEEVQRAVSDHAESFELRSFSGEVIPLERWPLLRALRGERFVDYDLEMRRQETGTSTMVSYSGTPVYNRAGEPMLAVLTVHDITERRRSEEALRKSEYKFSKIFNSAPTLIGISSLKDGRVVDVNENALQTLGFQREEVIGRTMSQIGVLVDERDFDLVAQALGENESGSVRNMEIRFRGRNGKTFIGLLSAEIIVLDDEQYMLSLVRDITERKRAEQALVRAKEEWERTFDSVPDLICVLDDQYRVVRVNRAMAERLGRKAEECEGLPCFSALHGTEAPPLLCPHASTLATGGAHEAEFYDSHMEGYFLVSTTPLLDAEGRVTGAVHVARDISERKRAEEEIERLNAALAARIADLEDSNQELEAFNRIVSHDLRQPLNTVGLSCQQLELQFGESLGREGIKPVELAWNAVLRMNLMIEELLKFSRSTHEELRRQTVDLSEIARAVMQELKMAEPQRQMEFICAEGVMVDGDPVLLRSVLENLLGNACKYTVTREDARVEFGTAVMCGEQVYFVRDNGMGFDMADAEGIFSPFKRLSAPQDIKGFGIGLATVHKIIRRHGGRVWAEGEPGKGAAFYFTVTASR